MMMMCHSAATTINGPSGINVSLTLVILALKMAKKVDIHEQETTFVELTVPIVSTPKSVHFQLVPVGANGEDGLIALLRADQLQEPNPGLDVATKPLSIRTTVLVTRPSPSTRVHGVDPLALITTRQGTS